MGPPSHTYVHTTSMHEAQFLYCITLYSTCSNLFALYPRRKMLTGIFCPEGSCSSRNIEEEETFHTVLLRDT